VSSSAVEALPSAWTTTTRARRSSLPSNALATALEKTSAFALDVAADAFHNVDDDYVIPPYGSKRMDSEDLIGIYRDVDRGRVLRARFRRRG
jgi:hypothetical protein